MSKLRRGIRAEGGGRVMRHQFCMKTPLGVLVLPTCTRCGARNPALTKDEDGAYTICDERVIRAVNVEPEAELPENGDVLKVTKGEALPVIDVDAPMPQVTPALTKDEDGAYTICDERVIGLPDPFELPVRAYPSGYEVRVSGAVLDVLRGFHSVFGRWLK